MKTIEIGNWYPHGIIIIRTGRVIYAGPRNWDAIDVIVRGEVGRALTRRELKHPALGDYGHLYNYLVVAA